MTTRRKAALLVAAAAAIAVVGFATNVFGAGASGPVAVTRGDAGKVQARPASGVLKVTKSTRKAVYLAGTVTIRNTDTTGTGTTSTVTLAKCPHKTHAVNGTLAAVHPTQAPSLTIRGFGPAVTSKKKKTPNAWFIDVNNALRDTTTGNPLSVKGFGTLICEKN